MSTGPAPYVTEYEGGYYYPVRTRRRRAEARPRPVASKRSHAAIPLAFAVLVAGLVLGQYWFFWPALFGIGLLFVAFSFLSSRLNPFSLSFYLSVKPSWLSIGTLAFLGFVLLGAAWSDYASGLGPLASAASHLP